MTEFRRTLPELLVHLAYGLLFCSLSTVPAFAYVFGIPWLGLLFLPLVFLFWLLKKFLKSFLLFSTTHLLFAAAATCTVHILFHDWRITLPVLLLSFLLLLFSYKQRLSTAQPFLSIGFLFAHAGFSLGCALLLDHMLSLRLYIFYAILTGVQFLLFLLNTHYNNLEDVLLTTSAQSKQHAKSILAFNNRFSLFFTALSLLFMLAFSLLPISDLIHAVLRFLKQVILAVFSLLPESTPSEETASSIPEQLPQENSLVELLGEAEPKTPLIPIEMIRRFVLIVLTLGVILGIVYGLYSVYRRFGETTDALGDHKEFLDSDNKNEKSSVRIPLYHWFTRPHDSIRRNFYKAVLRYHRQRKQPIDPSETSAEIAERIAPTINDISELNKQYEKVRYGQEQKAPKSGDPLKSLLGSHNK